MAYQITFCIDLFKGPRELQLSHQALTTLLNALYDIDCQYLRANPNTPLLYSSGVYYLEEPLGREDWQDIPTTLSRGNGDCEDLACWRAAELTVRQGIAAKPTFTYKILPGGGYLYHILTLWPSGQIEDPSRRLGMR